MDVCNVRENRILGQFYLFFFSNRQENNSTVLSQWQRRRTKNEIRNCCRWFFKLCLVFDENRTFSVIFFFFFDVFVCGLIFVVIGRFYSFLCLESNFTYCVWKLSLSRKWTKQQIVARQSAATDLMFYSVLPLNSIVWLAVEIFSSSLRKKYYIFTFGIHYSLSVWPFNLAYSVIQFEQQQATTTENQKKKKRKNIQTAIGTNKYANNIQIHTINSRICVCSVEWAHFTKKKKENEKEERKIKTE